MRCVAREGKRVVDDRKRGIWISIRYREFIVGLSPITNLTVVNLRKEDVPMLTAENLAKQLRIMKGFIYAHHALSGARRIAFQECFSKLAKRLIMDNK